MKTRALGAILAMTLGLAGCGGQTPSERTGVSPAERELERQLGRDQDTTSAQNIQESSIFELFDDSGDPNTRIEVNKYIWAATLQILDFMPIETVDPFSGVIVYGYGRPPGSGAAYRATVLVQDPALDARSLNLSMATRSGPVDRDTVRTVENAILTRARELRLQDNSL